MQGVGGATGQTGEQVSGAISVHPVQRETAAGRSAGFSEVDMPSFQGDLPFLV